MTKDEFNRTRRWLWSEIESCENMLLANVENLDWLDRWRLYYEGRINALRGCAAHLGIICPAIRWEGV